MQNNSSGDAVPGTPPSAAMPKRLESWKEIAAYLNRDVTTVQRWEKREGMPVHRHQHDKRGSVFALSSELDSWRQTRKARLEEETYAADEVVGEAVQSLPADRRARRWLFLGLAAAALIVIIALVAIRERTRAGVPTKIKSVAVLPFQNLSGDSSQDYFADA